MDTAAFLKAYNEGRNGANLFVRHSLARSFQYSDGVRDCAEAGLYWLIDIAATELPQVIPLGDLGILTFKVLGGRGDLKLEIQDDVPPAWERHIDLTDAPDGTWLFYIANEGERFAMILASEY